MSKKSKNRWGARVTVYPRKEILDPQGKAIAQALVRLGFASVAEVRAGKSFEITVEGGTAAAAEKAVRAMADQLLANPVVEDYSVEVSALDDGAKS